MKACPHCGYMNGDDVIFCHQCSKQIEKYSDSAIKRMPHEAQCPECDYYNPIETTKCLRCGYDLKTRRGVLVKDRRGRVSLIREVGMGPVASGFAWAALIGCLVFLLALTLETIGSTGNLVHFVTDGRGKLLLACWGAVAFFVGIEWKAGLSYRLRSVFVLILAMLVADWFTGEGNFTLYGAALDQVLLLVMVAVLMYCEVFILSSRILGSVWVAFIAFLGLYCSISPIITFFNGGTIIAAVAQNPNFIGNLPLFLGPSFLTLHVFLPYCFLAMLGSTLRAYLRSMEKVDGTKSIARFLNRRKEEARGELINLFVVGLTLYFGFSVLEKAGVPNAVGLFRQVIDRLF